MLANVFTKTLRDRQLGILIGGFGVVLTALLGLAVYSGLDDTFVELFEAMPDAYLAVLGLGGASNTGSIILGQTVSLMAPLVLGGLAISMGSAAIAGEERDGTLGILLGNPRSRRNIVMSKAAALVLLVVVGGALIWVGSYMSALAFGTDMSALHLGGAMLHAVAISIFFGFLALALGSWSGNRGISSGTTTGFLLVSFLAAGLLPLVSGLENLARFFPWYYLNSAQPLANGADWGHLSVLIGASVVLTVLSLVGVARRDLKIGEHSSGLVDRIRSHPLFEKVADRVFGKAKVSSIAMKTLTENLTLTVIGSLTILYVAILVGPFFNGLGDALTDFADAVPEALLALVGQADMSTAEGWYQSEVFSLVVPGALIMVTTVLGAKALAGEEEDNTMGVLLANPVKRAHVVTQKALALAVVAAGMGLATFLGTSGGILLGGLDVSYANIAATSLLAVLVGISFGYLALAIGAATGKRRATALTAAGLAFFAYFANAFLSVSEGLADWAKLSPFYYYLTSDPLVNGMPWGHAVVLVALSAAAFGVAIPLFERRDLRG